MTKRTARQTIMFPQTEKQKDPYAMWWVLHNKKLAERENLPIGTVIVGTMYTRRQQSSAIRKALRSPMQIGYGLSHEALHTALANTLGEENASWYLDQAPLTKFPIMARHGFLPLEMISKRLQK